MIARIISALFGQSSLNDQKEETNGEPVNTGDRRLLSQRYSLNREHRNLVILNVRSRQFQH